MTKTGNQLWVTINDKTANMPYVRQAVSNQLREENLVLVSPDGMQINDMPGTRGKEDVELILSLRTF